MSGTDGVITAVERDRRKADRYLIFIDGQLACTVHEDVMIRHRLLKGESVQPERLQQVLEDEEQQRAWSDALKQIGRRPRSEKEIRQYLRRRAYVPTLIERIVQRLRQQRYIHDADFAEAWTEQRIYSQKKGRRLIRQELQWKGIDPATIQQTLNRVPEDEERRIAFELAAKKWERTNGEPLAKQRKVAAFLLRRGYSSQLASSAVRHAAELQRESDTADEELWDWQEE